nr:hypothetical protein [uncultured Flavobacterium sp.]
MEASLSKHSIKELETPKYKEDLMNSLKKGNIQSVTFVIAGEERKQFVEANPHFKTVNVYDGSMQRINERESKEQKKSQSETKSEDKGVKQNRDVASESPESGPKKNTKKKKQGNSI